MKIRPDQKNIRLIPVKVRKRVKKEMGRRSRNLQESTSMGSVVYEASHRGNQLLFYQGHKYIKNNNHGANVYWKCTKWHNGCRARAITNQTTPDSCYLKNVHNHDALVSDIDSKLLSNY